MKKIILVLITLFSLFDLSAQSTDQQLANLYYTNGEFEKAVVYFEKIINKKSAKFDQLRYVECLEKTNKGKEAEKVLKRLIDANPNDKDYMIALGDFYERNEQISDRDKLFNNEIKIASKAGFTTVELYNSFLKKGKTDWCIKALEAGKKEQKRNYDFSEQFAEIYAITGKTNEMIDIYFEMLDKNPNYAGTIQANLSRIIDFQTDQNGTYLTLKERLLERIQKKPNEFVYPEMLIWLFIQKKEFRSALVQANALDTREKGLGQRQINLASVCLENDDYESARACYQTIIDKGEDHPSYSTAKLRLLSTRYAEITKEKNVSKPLILEAVSEFDAALLKYGLGRGSYQLAMEAAEIKAYYADQKDASIELLEKVLKVPGLTDLEVAKAKMLLGDVMVLKDDIWSASLYYMQVDKDFKFETIGSEAKFKNARVFYYDGDFNFAQSQLDVLKQSTSKLIANDAMKLSILITDNLGLDSNYTAMYQFAKADLLLEQHQFDKAFELYDSITTAFPAHGLVDEVLLRKAQAMKYQGKWEEAISYLDKIYTYHKYDILSDDAAFQMAEIYELNLDNKEKAIEYYKKILFECKGSLLTVEARKRFRALRGDAQSEEDLLDE
jgi:tetratricopeptide (TPR) repeat protein